MALFVDSQKQHFFAFFYTEDSGRYTGYFLAPSERSVQLIKKTLNVLVLGTYVGYAVLGALLLARIVLGPAAALAPASAMLTGLSALMMVAFMSVSVYPNFRTKRRLADKPLTCLNQISRRMYVWGLADLMLAVASGMLMPEVTWGEEGFLIAFLLGPIFVALVFAIWYYSKERSER